MSIVYAFNEIFSLIWPLLIRNLTPTFLLFVITLKVENEIFFIFTKSNCIYYLISEKKREKVYLMNPIPMMRINGIRRIKAYATLMAH